MQKFLALLLAAAIAFSFAACGKKTGDETTTTAPAGQVDNTTEGQTGAEGESTTVDGTTGDALTDPSATEGSTADGSTNPGVSTTAAPVSNKKPETTGTGVSKTGTGESTTVKPSETTTVKPSETTTIKPTTTQPATTQPATTQPATTQPATTIPATITAPVGGSMAQILTFYNKYANAMKSYKGRVTVTKKSGTVSTIKSITGGSVVKNLALKMLPNDYEQKPTYTFTNGKSNKDNKTLSSWLPRNYSPLMSELSPTGTNGVKSATCVRSGSGWKVTIVMKDDVVTGASALNAKPKYVSKCMDTLDLKAEDLDPFVLENANVNYTGCTIVAVFNAQGLMTKLDVTTPANITGKLKYGIIGINADVTGTYKGNYTFTY